MRATWEYEKCIIQSHAPTRGPRETICQYLWSFQSHRVDQGYSVNQWPCSSKCPSIPTTGRVIPPLHPLLYMGRCCFKFQEASVSQIINTLASFENRPFLSVKVGPQKLPGDAEAYQGLVPGLLYSDQGPHGIREAAIIAHLWRLLISTTFNLKIKRAYRELHFV